MVLICHYNVNEQFIKVNVLLSLKVIRNNISINMQYVYMNGATYEIYVVSAPRHKKNFSIFYGNFLPNFFVCLWKSVLKNYIDTKECYLCVLKLQR